MTEDWQRLKCIFRIFYYLNQEKHAPFYLDVPGRINPVL